MAEEKQLAVRYTAQDNKKHVLHQTQDIQTDLNKLKIAPCIKYYFELNYINYYKAYLF